MWQYAYRDAIGLDHLTLVEHDEPEPGPGQILVRMLAASVNYRDLAIASGHYHVGVHAPLVPLSDGAGEVVRCGEGVTRFAPGELVCPLYLPDWMDGPITPDKAARRLGGPTDGVFQQFMCLDESAAVKAPAHLDAAEAATLPVAALTAWHSLFAQGNLEPGMTVLIQGVGGVASFAIQFACLAGAKVIAIVRNEAALEQARALGAGTVIVSDDPQNWPAEVRRHCPQGVDRVIEISGTGLTNSIACCRGEGIVHLVGYTGGTAVNLDLFTAIRHAITLRAASAGSRASFEQMVRAMELARIRPLIGASFSRHDFKAALGALGKAGRAGKISIDLSQ